MPYKNKKDQKEYYQKNKEKLRQYRRKYYQTHKMEIRNRMAERYRVYKEKCIELLGEVCAGCGKDDGRRLVYHQIHGEEHLRGREAYKHIADNHEDFVRLCYNCHSSIHNVAKFPKLRGLLGKLAWR